MKCKNCGAEIPKNSSMCTNCGARINKNSDYVLLTAEAPAVIDNTPVKKKLRISSFMFVVISVVVIVAAGVLSFLYFYGIDSAKEQPKVNFVSGYGVINKDEQIIYVGIKDASSIQYIHGVELYDGTVKEKNIFSKEEPITTDYSYSKNVDDTFRTIFFDMDKLNLEPNKNYTYTFKITFSFFNDENRYTYYHSVNFTGSTKQDISDIIFDHTLSQNTTTTTTTTISQNTTTSQLQDSQKETSADVDYEFIYSGYWYTEPIRTEGEYFVSSIKFNTDGTYSATSYNKGDAMPWSVITNKNTYKIKGNKLHLNNGEASEESIYVIDCKKGTITQSDLEEGGEPYSLVHRNYNSIKNAEDFFGL